MSSFRAILLAALCGMALPISAQTVTVSAPAGQFQGDVLNGVNRFAGVPYAQPPVGALRWKAPVPKAPAGGVQGAHSFGSPCLQTGGLFGTSDPSQFGQYIGSEDCLYLNIWAPPGAQKRPVMVFVHGGSGVAGTGSLNIYDGTNFAKEQNAVYVSINYRLGFLGGMYLPALFDGNALDDSGDYSILDIIQSLKWVQQNIAAFGGDPGNVTLSGQSAGCDDLYSIIESPLAAGTFHKVLCMSGLQVNSTAAQGQLSATEVVGNLLVADGLISSTLDAQNYIDQVGNAAIQQYLAGKTGEEILTAGNNSITVAGGLTGPAPSLYIQTMDGTVIPFSATEAPPVVSKVPLIAGTVNNEAELLDIFAFTPATTTQQSVWALDQSDDPNLQITDFMPLPNYVAFQSASAALDVALPADVDQLATQLSLQMPVYRYSFDWQNYPSPWTNLLHAFHGLDVCLNFNSCPTDGTPNFFNFVPPSASRTELHQKMQAAIKGLMETGNPNEYLGQYGMIWPQWPASVVPLQWVQ